jgi:hypothetical protein
MAHINVGDIYIDMKFKDLLKERYTTEDITDEQRKKVATLFNVFRKGNFQIGDEHYRYILDIDNYSYHIDIGPNSGNIIVTFDGYVDDVIKVFIKLENGEDRILSLRYNNNDIRVYNYVAERLKNKFAQLGKIYLSF